MINVHCSYSLLECESKNVTRFFKVNQMLKKIFTNSFGILTSRILGFIRDLFTASILGANIYSDIFFVAFKLPNLFRRIFAEGAFVQSFLPSYTKTKQKNLFAATIFVRFFSIILLFSLLVTLFAPFFTKLIALGFNEELINLAAPYVAINFYYLLFIFCVTFLAALLQYKEHFATTAFSTALLNISLIGALLLYQKAPKEVIVFAMSVAVLVGGLLQLLAHLITAASKGVLKPLILGFFALKTKKNRIQTDLTNFYKNFFPAIWGNSTAQLSAFLDTWLASFLVSGTISYLYYANRVFQLPLALFAIATATALFPSIAKALKKEDEEVAIKLLKKSFWLLLFLLGAATIGGAVLAKEVVWLLFERGSFTHQDTLHTALVLQMYLIGLLFWGLAKLFSLWLYATHRQKEAAKIATYSLITNIIFSLSLIYPFGAAGLALASSLAGATQLALLAKSFGKKRLLALLNDRFAIYVPVALVIVTGVVFILKKVIDAYL